MKRLSILAFIIIWLPLAATADIIYPDGTKPTPEPYQLKKLSRGLMNSFLWIIDIPRSVYEVGHEEGITSSRTISDGLITKGPYRALRRFASGLYDLGTFFEHDKVLYHLEPEYLDPLDIFPGYSLQFHWETIDTAGWRMP